MARKKPISVNFNYLIIYIENKHFEDLYIYKKCFEKIYTLNLYGFWNAYCR